MDSDGGRDPTCSGSNIRKSQTISATQRDSYTKRFFFLRANCWPSSPEKPGYQESQKVGGEECIQENKKHSCTLPSSEKLLGDLQVTGRWQFSCRKKSPLLILISQGQNPPQFSLSFHLKLNALDAHGKPQSVDVTVALNSFPSQSTFFCIPPVPFVCCLSKEAEREEGLPGASLAHYLCISVIKR